MNGVVARWIGAACIAARCSAAEPAAEAPGEPLAERAAAVMPEPRQVEWQRLEFTLFIHFGLNTFTGREWGTGQEDPRIFNPAELDCRQWARAARAAGARAMLLVAKHHDGFCLWPSQYTDFSVKRSPWRNGRGDVLRDAADACRECGLKMGVYLSPADFHEPTYGADPPGYNRYFTNQLRELLTGYGPVSEVFFDGAQPVSRKQTYDYPGYYRLIRRLQPNAVIAVKGPDVRWVGNENGCARESEWSVLALPLPPEQFNWPDQVAPDLGSRSRLAKGKYLHWYPAEADVCLGRSWFWHPGQDDNLRSLAELLDIYYNTVGRNAVLLLNVSPDQRGLITEPAARRLEEFGAALARTFATNYAAGSKVSASNVRAHDPKYRAQNALGSDPGAFWMADDNCRPVELVIDLPGPRRFNRALVQEHIESGQRIEAFAVDAWAAGQWRQIARGATVGYKRLLRFDAVETEKVRLRILECRVCPTVSGLGLFLQE